ncbi:TPA: hypothetical protein ACK3SM_001789 [Burkholderia cepacia]|uniref:Transmembrane protein, putative n=1 Tax=Medicago truncatula TaxID=3880 RepID=A0A072TD35_MEDTR|nr:hypothetical protein [Burkholderia cepacia]KEH15166.1 transmembrane protein, putative [Medicago truncatula]MCA8360906.1 hypothetical protein [Burkholderia cepacia]HDR9759237.1 hypothetical protein [Burkholderia cepacia ATCC 25416]HDV6367832.1 hypothetical protein [Burkholderia cepacia]
MSQADMYKKSMRRVAAILGATATAFSATMWHVSAKAGIAASALPSTADKAIKSLQTLSLQENLWAAQGAVVAGILFAIAILLEDD